MKLQKRRSGDQYREHKKSPGRLHTWKNDRKAGGGAYRHQCTCRVRNQQKCRFALLESVPNHRYSCYERLVVAARGRQLHGMTYMSSCRRKEADGSQQASLLSNSLQQGDDKCRGLLWPDAFTKGAYSPAVLNAASR
ncbi:transposable element Tcb1 transposase [Trichonephila clavipes]|nr:transposable element Tcb1 transposase [Trichonephila clavipes]